MKLRCALRMFSIFMALGATTAFAQVAYVLPELLPPPDMKAEAKKPAAAAEPLMIPVPAVRLTLGLADTPVLQGIPLERPQALTVLRNRLDDEVPPPPPEADGQDSQTPAPVATPEQAETTPPVSPSSAPTVQPQRTEHLSALEESTLFGAPAWTTEVAMPHAGVHHFIMETKPTWTPSQNRFVQHIARTLQPSQGNLELWDRTSGLDFEILPLTRPFNLCAGMSFSGQVMHNGQPVGNTTVEAVWMPDPSVGRKKNQKPLQSTEQLVKTDGEGIFTVSCPWPGWWGFSAVTSGGDPLKDPEGNLKPVDTKTTLWVPLTTCSPGAAS